MSWFRRVQREFAAITAPLVGKPLVAVEVGVWQGDSAEWTLENVLTNPEAIGYGIDPYLPDEKHPQAEVDAIYEAAAARLNCGGSPHFRLVRERSIPVLQRWRDYCVFPIDLLYLDGAHDAASVVQDFCAAWPHLNVGGLVVADDFGIGKRKSIRHVPEAVEAIALSFGDMLDYFHRGPRLAAFRVLSKDPPIEDAVRRFVEKRQTC